MSKDERESGLRMILNLGHTLGHASRIGSTDYRKLLHGEAVGWGLIASLYLGKQRETITDAQFDRLMRLVYLYGPLPALKLNAQKLVDATAKDKKHLGNVRRFVLPVGIGDACVVEDVTGDELMEAAAARYTARFSETTARKILERGLIVSDKIVASGIGSAAVRVAGTTPEGATDEHSAAVAVQTMFNSIAPRYDLLNHVLSMNVDRLWWWRTARRFRSVLTNPDAAISDICCGTGDMTMALLKYRPVTAKSVIAVDFAREMLARGARKFARPFSSHGTAIPLEADALHLPMRAECLDLITTAFGFSQSRKLSQWARESFTAC